MGGDYSKTERKAKSMKEYLSTFKDWGTEKEMLNHCEWIAKWNAKSVKRVGKDYKLKKCSTEL